MVAGAVVTPPLRCPCMTSGAHLYVCGGTGEGDVSGGGMPRALGMETGQLAIHVLDALEGVFARCLPSAASILINVPAIYPNALPQNITSSSSPGTLSTSTLYDCWRSIKSHFFAQQMGLSHAPYPCRPRHGHPPQNQRILLLCMTDHSRGHTEAWVFLTPTQGAAPKRWKTLPGTCPARLHTLLWSGVYYAQGLLASNV